MDIRFIRKQQRFLLPALLALVIARPAAPAPACQPIGTLSQTRRSDNPKSNPPLLRPQLVLQRGHDSMVQAIAFSPDGTLLATAGDDWPVKLWNLRTGELRYSFAVDGSWHASLAFSLDSKVVVSFLRFGKALLRDTAIGLHPSRAHYETCSVCSTYRVFSKNRPESGKSYRSFSAAILARRVQSV